MSRTDNVDVSLGERVTAANNWGADRFISVHHNASVNRDYNATETYVYYYADRTAIDMQENVHRRLVEGLGLRDGQTRTAGFTCFVIRPCLQSLQRPHTSVTHTKRRGSKTWAIPGAKGITSILVLRIILVWRRRKNCSCLSLTSDSIIKVQLHSLSFR